MNEGYDQVANDHDQALETEMDKIEDCSLPDVKPMRQSIYVFVHALEYRWIINIRFCILFILHHNCPEILKKNDQAVYFTENFLF